MQFNLLALTTLCMKAPKHVHQEKQDKPKQARNGFVNLKDAITSKQSQYISSGDFLCMHTSKLLLNHDLSEIKAIKCTKRNDLA